MIKLAVIAVGLAILATLLLGNIPNTYLNKDNYEWGHPFPWIEDQYLEETEIAGYPILDVFSSKVVVDFTNLIYNIIFWFVVMFITLFMFKRFGGI